MAKHLLCAAAVMMLAVPAFGHAKLRGAVPAADAQLAAAPTSLTLSFNENVKLAALTLTAEGKNIPVTVDRSAPAAAQVTVALPALAAGKYQVQWTALSIDDGHVTRGTYSFTIMSSPPPSATHAAPSTPTAPAAPSAAAAEPA